VTRSKNFKSILRAMVIDFFEGSFPSNFTAQCSLIIYGVIIEAVPTRCINQLTPRKLKAKELGKAIKVQAKKGETKKGKQQSRVLISRPENVCQRTKRNSIFNSQSLPVHCVYAPQIWKQPAKRSSLKSQKIHKLFSEFIDRQPKKTNA
jgi:hypothetical protein